ncbi:hypothetical protein BC567DRAFT_249818 [Phyllosticta citribraziliensis]
MVVASEQTSGLDPGGTWKGATGMARLDESDSRLLDTANLQQARAGGPGMKVAGQGRAGQGAEVTNRLEATGGYAECRSGPEKTAYRWRRGPMRVADSTLGPSGSGAGQGKLGRRAASMRRGIEAVSRVDMESGSRGSRFRRATSTRMGKAADGGPACDAIGVRGGEPSGPGLRWRWWWLAKRCS